MGEWWEERSLAQKIGLGILMGIGGAAFLFLCGWVVMLLWNWLMPEIFGLRTINYWQGWGLLVLSSILFGRKGGSGSGAKSDRKRKRELRRAMREGGEPESEPEAGPDSGDGAKI